MKKALGLIETKGLVAAVAAADRALKTANVVLEGKEITEPGYVTITFSGELTEVQLAVAAGTEAARDTGELVSSIVLAQPDKQLSILLPELGKIDIKPVKALSENAPVKTSPVKEEKANIEDPPPAPEVVPISSGGNGKSLDIFLEADVAEQKQVETDDKRDLTFSEKSKPLVHSKNEAPKKEKKHKAALSKEVKNAIQAKPKVESSLENKKSSHLPSTSEDTIARLRREALGIYEPEKAQTKVAEAELYNGEGQDLNTLNVHQLRKLARGTPDFPIFGRKISKANRDELLKLFNGMGE